MLKYDVPFTISGYVRGVEAASPEDAKAYVDAQYDERELAELGALETFDGEAPRGREETEHQRQMRRIYLADVMDAALKEGPKP